MRLTGTHMTYFSILDTMQKIDVNGEWLELAKELRDGETTLTEVKQICESALNNWIAEDPTNASLKNLVRCLEF